MEYEFIEPEYEYERDPKRLKSVDISIAKAFAKNPSGSGLTAQEVETLSGRTHSLRKNKQIIGPWVRRGWARILPEPKECYVTGAMVRAYQLVKFGEGEAAAIATHKRTGTARHSTDLRAGKMMARLRKAFEGEPHRWNPSLATVGGSYIFDLSSIGEKKIKFLTNRPTMLAKVDNFQPFDVITIHPPADEPTIIADCWQHATNGFIDKWRSFEVVDADHKREVLDLVKRVLG